MKGVQFIVDDRGKKNAVIINLEKNFELWEDIYDTMVFRRRIKEPRESLATVKRKLQHKGKLRG